MSSVTRTAIRVRGPREGLRRRRGGARDRLRRPHGRGLRPARPERGGQDDDRRDPRGLPAARRGRRVSARRRPVARLDARIASGSASCCSTRSSRRRCRCARCTRCSPATTGRPRAVDEVIELVGLAEKRDARVKTLSGGQKRRLDLARAGRRPRAGVPRRADDRFRPVGAPHRLGSGPLAPLARQDDPAHDALPRRGAAARRPGRGHSRGRADPHRHAARADRRRAAGRDPVPRGRPRGRARHRRADEGARRADGEASPRDASSRASRYVARDSRTSTSASSTRNADDRSSFTAPAPAARLLAEQGVGGLHLRLPADALPPPRRGLRRGHRRRAGGRPALVGILGYGCANTALAGLAITLVLRGRPGS